MKLRKNAKLVGRCSTAGNTLINAIAMIALLLMMLPTSTALAQQKTESDPLSVIQTDDGKVFSAQEILKSLDPLALAQDYQTSNGGDGTKIEAESSSQAEMAFGPIGGPNPGTVIGADGRTRVNPTTSYPNRAVAYITLSFPNGTSGTCTGWFIGPRTVATAGHCVHDKNAGGWATNVKVYPGRNANASPYGSSTARRLFSVTGWTSSKSANYDYGAIQLNTPLGNTVGWFGFRWQSSNSFAGSYTITGYPGDKPAGTLWTMSDNPGVRRVETYRLFHAIDTYGGQSGAPMYHNYSSTCNPCSVAFHAYGTGGDPNRQYNSGTRITQPVFNNLTAWKNYQYP